VNTHSIHVWLAALYMLWGLWEVNGAVYQCCVQALV